MADETQLGGGRYTVRGVLGEGAQGKTLDAVSADGRSVAIKRFAVRDARAWKDVELAEREARVLATLDHPLVPRYVEHFEEDGALFLVMEKVEGENIEAQRRRQGPIPEDEVRRFLGDADRALTYLHGRSSPIVHRDVKPRNVVRRPNGSYVIVDFGAVAELLARRGNSGSTIVGTMGYMAPEQFQGRASPTADVYAVGATALAMLTGLEPESMPHRGLRIDVRAAAAGRASESLLVSLERMLEPDPDVRAKSLAEALDGSRGPAAPAQVRVISVPPPPLVPGGGLVGAPPVDMRAEDAAVKSIRKLLWLLWGLGWILVPVFFGSLLHWSKAIPLVMFGSLAALFIVTWHNGALIRSVLRRVGSGAAATPQISSVRHRVAESASPKVRVKAPSVPPLDAADEVGRTEVQDPASVASRREGS